jgi:hypothetical protein
LEYYLAMIPGGTTYETTQLNIESLWAGGPFADIVSSLAKHIPRMHLRPPQHLITLLLHDFFTLSVMPIAANINPI